MSAQSACRITANFEQTSLQSVLDSISRQCPLTFSYDPAFASQQSIPSLKFKKTPLKAAIAEIEGHCPVRFVQLSEGEYAIHVAAPAPGGLPIQGTVRDGETGTPLPGAVVRLKNARQGAITDAQGQFKLTPSQANDQLFVSYLGYYQDSARIAGGKLAKTDFSLKSIPIEITGLLVSEESELVFRNGPQGIAMSPRQLDAVAVLGEPDVFRTLQWLPGVSATEESSNGLFVRGGTPDQNLVLIDDIPIYNTGHFFGMFHAFNADALTRVNIQRGGFSAEHGGATAGLIDIDTKPRQLDSLEAALNLNFAATSAFVSAPLANKKIGLMLAGRRSYNDVFRSPLYQRIAGNVFQTGSIFQNANQVDDDDDDDDAETYTVDPLSNFHDIHCKITAQLGPKDDLSFSFYNGRDAVKYFFALRDSLTDGIRYGAETLTLTNYATGLRWNRQISGRLNLGTSAFFSSFRGNFFNDQTIEDEIDTLDYNSTQFNGVDAVGLKSALHWNIAPQHRLHAGAQLTRFASSFELSTADQQYIWHDSLSLDGEVAALFVNYKYQPGKKLLLQPGLRGTFYGPDEEFFMEPRIHARYSLAKHLRLTATSGYYRQILNPITVSNSLKLGTEFLTLSSRENGLDATTAIQSSLGISYLAPGIWASAEVYHKDIGGLQRYTRRFDQETNANEIQDLLNDGTGQVLGIDLFVRGQKGPWSGWASYTLSDVIHQFDSINDGFAFQADFAHRHELKLVNVIKIKRWEWSVTWIFANGKPYSEATGIATYTDNQGQPFYELIYPEINNKRLPAYHRLDLNVTYSAPLARKLRLRTGISVFNLYDRENIRDRNYSVEYPDDANDPLEIVGIDRELLGFSPNIFLGLQF